ncbi:MULTISPECIES: CdaR family transcriptional regulator [unclassified Fusibacter]|uniref:PucR family transcriptional regulator n=1 Tax=unclassified Fusibacter TaxID=2624464 RepID=UPI001FAA842C|nr:MULTISPECIES: PucR family transcriptional regulator [unclassified Fusibacter]MCK8061711.1 helix-turn-helix domain-containing protein [Fusibacter sp. A2]
MAFSMDPIMRLPYFKGKEFVVLNVEKKMIFKSITKTKLSHSLAMLEERSFVYDNGWGFIGFTYDHKQYYAGIKDTEERANVAVNIIHDIISAQQAPNKQHLLERLMCGDELWHTGFLTSLGCEDNQDYSMIICTADQMQIEDAVQAIDEVLSGALLAVCDHHIVLLVHLSEVEEISQTLQQLFMEDMMVEPYIVYGITISDWTALKEYYQKARRMLLIGKRLYTSKRRFSVNHLIFALAIDATGKDKLISINKEKQIQTIVDDQELIATVIHFFENNLNVTDTSNKLFIHRNTLLYRLGKIEQVTGYDLRKFEDAINFYYLMTKQLL